jgi:hypothetical protein
MPLLALCYELRNKRIVTCHESQPGPITIRGRTFSAEELCTIRAIIATASGEHRFALSKRVCEALAWHQPNGRLKDRACRDVLARLDGIGMVRLPPRRRPPVRRRPIPLTESTAPRLALSVSPRAIDAGCFTVVSGSGKERLWNELVERYHYLGYGVSLGPHIKYLVAWHGEPIACMAFGGAAWRVAARDRFIGWDDRRRASHLHLVVNNTRFLVLPWVKVPNLASRLLALAAIRIGGDWHDRYAYSPLLLETFVDATRHTGTCYRAANWTLVGHTKGRGRMDRHFRAQKSIKLVLAYPLVEQATARLRRDDHGGEHSDAQHSGPSSGGAALWPVGQARASGADGAVGNGRGGAP